jgi:hypothetical protein
MKINRVKPDRAPDKAIQSEEDTQRANSPWNGEDQPEDD